MPTRQMRTMKLRGVAIAALVEAAVAGCASSGFGEGAASLRSATSKSSLVAVGAAPTPIAGRKAIEAVDGVTDTDLDSMVTAALADAADRVRPGSPAPTLFSAEAVTWPDGSLGCPVPGRMYTMALVPGYRIQIQSGAELFDYHAGRRGKPVFCPAGRATKPAPNTRI